MKKEQMTDLIMAAKISSGITWEELGKKTGLDPVCVAAGCLGSATMSTEEANAISTALGLGEDVAKALTIYPNKGQGQVIPSDPLIYRFYEIAHVYGTSLKEVIHEKFGDGIMSAIDFKMTVDKEEAPTGDRVVVTMNGKFLPYKKW